MCMLQGMAMIAKDPTMASHHCMAMMPHSPGRGVSREIAMGKSRHAWEMSGQPGRTTLVSVQSYNTMGAQTPLCIQSGVDALFCMVM